MTAKQMFKELGFEFSENKYGIYYWQIKDKFEISFDKLAKDVAWWYSTRHNEEIIEAINKQIEELGWNDENNNI